MPRVVASKWMKMLGAMAGVLLLFMFVFCYWLSYAPPLTTPPLPPVRRRPNYCIFGGSDIPGLRDLCAFQAKSSGLKTGHGEGEGGGDLVCRNDTLGIEVIIRQHALRSALDTMDLLIDDGGALDLPFGREHGFAEASARNQYYVVDSVAKYDVLTILCETRLRAPLFLPTVLRPRATFYAEDGGAAALLAPFCEGQTCNAKAFRPSVQGTWPADGRPVLMDMSVLLQYRIADACIRPNGDIYRPADDPVASLRRAFLASLHYGCGRHDVQETPSTLTQATLHVNKPVVALAARWSGAYYHWLGESLPRAHLGIVQYVHVGEASDKHVGMLKHVYRAVLVPLRGEVCAASVVWPTPATCGCGFPAVINAVRARAVPKSMSATLRGACVVYLHRRKNAPRHFAQYDALLEALVAANASVVVHTGDEDHADTVSIFRRAACVVGPHGAGFTNLLFSRMRTPVIEVLPAATVGFLPYALSLGLQWHGFVANGTRDSPLSFAPPALAHFLQRVTEICVTRSEGRSQDLSQNK